MNSYEKEEISRLPAKYRPMTAWGYFGYQILFSIPLIGFICLLVCAFSSSNINRRSFARSYFCVVIIILAMAGIAIGIMIATGGLEYIMEIIGQLL